MGPLEVFNLAVSVVLLCIGVPVATPVPSPSISPTTTPTDLVTSPLGSITVIVVVVGIVAVVIAVPVTLTVICIVKKKCKMRSPEKGCGRGRKNLGQNSVNLDSVFSELIPMTPKWKQLGEVIGIDDCQVDEIFTNNERDEECLRAVLDTWMKKSPNWNTVTDSLRKIGEDQLARSVYHKYVLPRMVEPRPKLSSSEGKIMREMVEPPTRDSTQEETCIVVAGDGSQNDIGGVEAAEEEKGDESGVQESQPNSHSYATYAYPQACETRPLSDVQNSTTSYMKEERKACTSGDDDVSSQPTIGRTLVQRNQPTTSTIRDEDVIPVENGMVVSSCIPHPGLAELQPLPEINRF